MLWHKAWLETRFRLLLAVGVGVVCFTPVYGAGSPGSRMIPLIVGSAAASILVLAAVLASDGIVTQSQRLPERGSHGSTIYTLSLPVSRLRLFAMRAAFAGLEIAAGIAAMCAAVWIAFPVLRQAARGEEMLEYALVLAACVSAFYFGAVLLATMLEGVWRIYAVLLLLILLWWMPGHIALPPFANLTGAMTDRSPLVAHSIPWNAIGFSVALAACLFLAALKIVRVREY